jgi:UDP-glucose:(heptosyl)LPS alpha-1,3-glucosyltransferase
MSGRYSSSALDLTRPPGARIIRGPAREDAIMQIAFCLFKYFPFGGLQRDCLEIAQACRARGHEVTLFTREWTGSLPEGLNIQIVPSHGLTNHSRCNSFVKAVLPHLQSERFDVVVGFNKMPGLDLYYAGDPCYQARVRKKYLQRWVPFHKFMPRFRRYVALEKAVFAPRSQAEVILLSPLHQEVYARQYGTPKERFHVLSPGICNDRHPSPQAGIVRKEIRKEFLRSTEETLLLMVGSDWRGKGFDRTAQAVASLPAKVRHATRLVAVGETRLRPYAQMAHRLGIDDRVSLLPPRHDIARFFHGADLLVHAAYSENTGGVILESMRYGLPVLTTDTCGYAEHVTAAHAGFVIPSPFRQEHMNHCMFELLQLPDRTVLGENAHTYTQTLDLYSRPSRVVDLIEARTIRNRHAVPTP